MPSSWFFRLDFLSQLSANRGWRQQLRANCWQGVVKSFSVMDNLRVKTVRILPSSWRGFRKGFGWNIFRKTFAFIRSFVVWHCCERNLHSRKINKRVNKYFPFDKFDSLMKFHFAFQKLVNYILLLRFISAEASPLQMTQISMRPIWTQNILIKI